MVAIGCVALIGLSFACFIALMIIGLAVGDGTSASGPSSTTEQQAATAEQSSPATVPTHEPSGALIPLDTYAPVSSQWRVAVTGTIPDATGAVLERNSFNSEPDDGKQFFIATVSVRNNGAEPDVFPATLLFRAFGASGYEYSTFDDFCGVVPDAYEHQPIAPGETATGNVCWSVLHDDAASLVMRSVEFSGGYQEQIFSLRK